MGEVRHRGAIMAAFRPLKCDIAVFVKDGERGQAASVLELDEARALHGALGLALRLAATREDPVGAVEIHGDRLIAVRESVAAAVAAGYVDREAPHVRFAARIMRGQADDSEPMQIGLGVARRLMWGQWG